MRLTITCSLETNSNRTSLAKSELTSAQTRQAAPVASEAVKEVLADGRKRTSISSPWVRQAVILSQAIKWAATTHWISSPTFLANQRENNSMYLAVMAGWSRSQLRSILDLSRTLPDNRWSRRWITSWHRNNPSAPKDPQRTTSTTSLRMWTWPSKSSRCLLVTKKTRARKTYSH